MMSITPDAVQRISSMVGNAIEVDFQPILQVRKHEVKEFRDNEDRHEVSIISTFKN
jgi:hypothetical protein